MFDCFCKCVYLFRTQMQGLVWKVGLLALAAGYLTMMFRAAQSCALLPRSKFYYVQEEERQQTTDCMWQKMDEHAQSIYKNVVHYPRMALQQAAEWKKRAKRAWDAFQLTVNERRH